MLKSNGFVPSSTLKWCHFGVECKKFIRLNFKKLVYLLSPHCHKNNLCINSFLVNISKSRYMESIKKLCVVVAGCLFVVGVKWMLGGRVSSLVFGVVQLGLNNNGPAQPSSAQTAFNKLRTKLYSCKLGTSKDIRVNLCFSQRQPTFRELWQRQM